MQRDFFDSVAIDSPETQKKNDVTTITTVGSTIKSLVVQIRQMRSTNVKEVFRKACDAVIIHFQSSDLRSVLEKVFWESLEVIIVDESETKENESQCYKY